MGRTSSVILTLLGLFLFLGSCVPMGIVIYEEVTATPTASVDLAGPGGSDQASFTAVPGTLAQFSIDADIRTSSVQENPDSLDVEYQARFRFPIRYSVRGSDSTLVTKDMLLAWSDGGMLTTSNEEVTSTGGTLRAVTETEKFTVPADGRVEISVQFDPDTTYEAEVTTSRLHFYEGLIDYTWYFVSAASMFAVGFIMALVGFIFTVSRSAQSAVQASGGPVSPAATDAASIDDARQKAMLIQLSALSGYFIPFGSLIFPIVLWMIWRDRDPYINNMGRESVNFQLSMLVYYMICVVLFLIVIGIPLLIAALIFHLTFIIVGAVQASRGTDFRYPLIIRFIKA